LLPAGRNLAFFLKKDDFLIWQLKNSKKHFFFFCQFEKQFGIWQNFAQYKLLVCVH
jgi:hypothetical protein